MLRGRIVSMNGVPVEKITPPSDIAWVLNGDRGVTFADEVPAGSKIVAGHMVAEGLCRQATRLDRGRNRQGLPTALGDPMVVNVLGRNVEATIGAVRRVEWESLGINFVMVFSPNTFKGAPVTISRR